VAKLPGRARGGAVARLALSLVGLVALTLAGCGLAGAGPVAADHFPDRNAQEVAEAISRGDVGQVESLIAGGVPVGSTGKDGITLLQWALFEGERRAFVALLDLGADIDQHGIGGATVMHSAATVTAPEFLEVLLERGASPDLRHARTQRTPLMQAVGVRTDAQFQRLLAAGADVGAADSAGHAAAHLAAMVNAGEQVLALLRAGADPLARNAQGHTFQQYFWQTPESVLTDEARAQRQAVADWLTAHGVPVGEVAES